MTHCWSMRYGHKDSLLHHGQSIWGQQTAGGGQDERCIRRCCRCCYLNMHIINAAIMSNLKSLYCPYLVVTTENNSNFEDLEVAICYKKQN